MIGKTWKNIEKSWNTMDNKRNAMEITWEDHGKSQELFISKPRTSQKRLEI
jgi:hypothetical protein